MTVPTLSSQPPISVRGARAVLVVGHPGHELRVFGWMAAARPVVHVITDGSGSAGASRLASTTTVLEGVGARPGSIYGRMTDREIYGAIIAGDHERFIALAEELAEALASADAEAVAGDGIEGFNPSHDVCRYVINAAVRLAGSRRRQAIACYAFPLDGAPDAAGDRAAGPPLTIQLDAEALDCKLQAAREYEELRHEVGRALERYGTEPFRREHLWPVDLSDPYGWDPARVPFYESVGAERVKTGAYEHVITFRDHVKPLADALWCRSAVTV